MKSPKSKRRHCPYCKKHTEHKISQAKKKTLGSKHTLSRGGQKRTKKRGRRAGTGNFGRYSRPAINKRKMSGKKLSKKTDFRYTCKECKKTHTQKKGKRAKKVEFV